MREKKRFVEVAIEGVKPKDEREAKALLSKAVLEVLGENGFSEAAFAFASFDVEKQVAVVKCATASLEQVIAALALKRFHENQDVALRVLRVYGSFPKG